MKVEEERIPQTAFAFPEGWIHALASGSQDLPCSVHLRLEEYVAKKKSFLE
jgi:hypothetical protein